LTEQQPKPPADPAQQQQPGPQPEAAHNESQPYVAYFNFARVIATVEARILDLCHNPNQHRRRDQRHPERPGDADHPNARICAQHEQLAMREVHDAEQPKDDREAERKQPQRGPEDEPVQ